ncbi:hypothetical protein ACFLT1_07525, partial [Bacteroidota bacterium]
MIIMRHEPELSSIRGIIEGNSFKVRARFVLILGFVLFGFVQNAYSQLGVFGPRTITEDGVDLTTTDLTYCFSDNTNYTWIGDANQDFVGPGIIDVNPGDGTAIFNPSTVGATGRYTIEFFTGSAPQKTRIVIDVVSATGTINLTSGAGTSSQSACVDALITPITYSTTGATTAIFTGLPAGVTGSWAANVATITGDPDPAAAGTYNYTVQIDDACGLTTTGTITVNTLPVATTSNDGTCVGEVL